MIDRYKVEEIEAAADVVVWCCDEAPGFAADRPQDKAVVANIVEAMRKYAAGELGEQPIPFSDADRIIAIGSDGMMNAVRLARHGVLKPYLKPGHRALGSINSPMQCMMKEICAQCLQLHRDPVTGKETVVFSCFNQDQELDRVDFACLRQRLRQNGVQEKIGALWIDRSLRKIGARSTISGRPDVIVQPFDASPMARAGSPKQSRARVKFVKLADADRRGRDWLARVRQVRA